jgi:hypothetical protein
LVVRWRWGRTLGFYQQAADGPQVQFQAGRLQKVVLPLISHYKLFTIIALAWKWKFTMAAVRYGADL